jgi:hypothetical protein
LIIGIRAHDLKAKSNDQFARAVPPLPEAGYPHFRRTGIGAVAGASDRIFEADAKDGCFRQFARSSWPRSRNDHAAASLAPALPLAASAFEPAIAPVDYTGGLVEGRLVRGHNPVLMELVLEPL